MLLVSQNMTEEELKLPNNIRKLRDREGWTQEELAEKVDSSKTHIYRLEKGLSPLDEGWAIKFGRIFNVPPLEIWSEKKMLPKVAIIGYVSNDMQVHNYILNEGESLQEVSLDKFPGINIKASEGCIYETNQDICYPIFAKGTLFLCNKSADLKTEFDGLSIISVKNGATYIGRLRKTGAANLFSIDLSNQRSVENVEIEYAHKVINIRPL